MTIEEMKDMAQESTGKNEQWDIAIEICERLEMLIKLLASVIKKSS